VGCDCCYMEWKSSLVYVHPRPLGELLYLGVGRLDLLIDSTPPRHFRRCMLPWACSSNIMPGNAVYSGAGFWNLTYLLLLF